MLVTLGAGTLAMSLTGIGIPIAVGTILLGVSGAAKVVAEASLQKTYKDLPEGHSVNE